MLRRSFVSLFAALALAIPATASAQGVMDEMHRDLADLQMKMVDLAKAMPEGSYGWRPAAGVRSVGEVFLHVAADNYLIPIYLGAPAPAATGVTSDYNTALTYEKRTLTKAQIVAELEASFNHLHQALNATSSDSNLNDKVNFFGQEWSRARGVILTVTHLHEHLGQAIAYARSNNVKPPWSN